MHIPCQRAIGIRATRGQSSRAGRKRNALPTSSPSRRRCDGEYAGHGDDSVIWVSGPAGGALAFGRVTGYPAPATEAQLSDPYWAETHRPKPSDMFLPIEVTGAVRMPVSVTARPPYHRFYRSCIELARSQRSSALLVIGCSYGSARLVGRAGRFSRASSARRLCCGQASSASVSL